MGALFALQRPRDTTPVVVQMVKLPLYPQHPERVCWGCDRYCPAHELACGNGSERTPHPIELFGEDWLEWSAQQLGEEPVEREPAPAGSRAPSERASQF